MFERPSLPFLPLTLCTGNRMVIRIMLMVPIYAIASLIALFSLEAAFVIDVVRDIYEVRIQSDLPANEAHRQRHASGVCDLLFLPTLGRVHGRGTIPAHSSARTASEGRGVSVHPTSPGTRPQ